MRASSAVRQACRTSPSAGSQRQRGDGDSCGSKAVALPPPLLLLLLLLAAF
jgi:hypothetical protein